ncbi:MAG: DUF389 domain-containing protein [Thermoleophilaceae bacterium]|nr:DUF389 domain-containing protein [Thermoleophilaceae bacterium]
MIHMRIVAPAARAEAVVRVLMESPAVLNVVHLHEAAEKPRGDLILCDVAREEASIVIDDLRTLGIPRDGSIAVEAIDTVLSESAERAEQAARGLPSDAVIWEEVEERTAEGAELSASFLAFMVLAMLIGAVGIILDSPILIVGAMVVGPEFGPLAGLCVAVIQKRGDLARRSFVALAVGFPLGIVVTFVVALALKLSGLAPADLSSGDRPLTDFISQPGFFSFFVAFLAGMAGVLSLTSAKSGALIGVLISVTTIPAAANVGLAAAYWAWSESQGALLQLLLNLTSIVLAGLGTLAVQRQLFEARRRRHQGAPRTPLPARSTRWP